MEYIFFIFLLLIVFYAVLWYQKLIRSNKPFIFKILPLLLFLLLPLWAFFQPRDDQTNITKPLESFVGNVVPTENPSNDLGQIIKSEIANTTGTYAVAIKNLETGEYYYYNSERKFETASLYKLWVMGAIYEEIEKGNLSLNQNIGFEAVTINERLDIASDSAEFTEGFVGNTVDGALERMITVSDNYSAHILYLTIGWNKVGEFLENYGFSNSSTDTRTTTASDILEYFENVYKGEIVNERYSSEMIERLKRQELNDRIPKYLPEGTVVAHKTGELYAVKHDAGIVFSPNGDYIIVLLSETPSQTTAAEIEAKLSEKVWEYFNQ